MRNVNFISGEGYSFSLTGNYEIAISEINPWQTEWGYDSIEEQFGIRISQFRKAALALDVTLKFRGWEYSISQNLNEFFAACERDVLIKKPGRLYIDDEYLTGYFIKRTTTEATDFYGYSQSLVFLAPYPFWVKPETKTFYASQSTTTDAGLDYPYDYPYDYAKSEILYDDWNLGHYAPSDFLLMIQGPATNPEVFINGVGYKLNCTLQNGEYVTIDSRAGTIIRTSTNGQTDNFFHYRETEFDTQRDTFFQKIDPRVIKVTWDKTFSFTLTIYTERSEPKWKVAASVVTINGRMLRIAVRNGKVYADSYKPVDLVFDIDPYTGVASVEYGEGYAGPEFLIEEGNLVIV